VLSRKLVTVIAKKKPYDNWLGLCLYVPKQGVTQHMNQEDLRVIFDEARKADGGVLDRRTLAPDFPLVVYSALDFFRNELRSTESLNSPANVVHNIYIDIVANYSLNAVAFEVNGHEFIGVFVGTILLLLDTFAALFSHPAFCPEVGDSSKESSSSEALRDYIIRPLDTEYFQMVPKAPQRVTAAQHLTVNAQNFILAHEGRHIGAAHLKYIQQSFGISDYFAYPSEPFPVPVDVFQALELHADEHGVGVSLNMLSPSLDGRVFPNTGGLARDFGMWATSIAVLFALFNRQATETAIAPAPLHPSPDIRFYNAWWSALDVVLSYAPEMEMSFWNQMEKAVRALRSFFIDIGLTSGASVLSVPDQNNIERNEAVKGHRYRIRSLETEALLQMEKERSLNLRKQYGLSFGDS